jgi:DNA-binding beta-propeller fold protein YncE
VLTFIVDSANRIRPLIGIAGSASVGNPIDIGFDVVRSDVPPAHDYMIATTGATWPVFVQVRGSNVTVRTMDSMLQRVHRANGLPPISRIALSPSGSSAALLSESASKIYAFSNLSQSPTLTGTFDTTALGQPTAFAINDDGNAVILGTSDGNVGALFLIKLGLPAALIARCHHPSAMMFLHKSDYAIVADDAENEIYIVNGGQIAGSFGDESGIAGPVAVASSNDNRKVFVGNAQTGSVVTIGYDGTVTEPLFCKCALTGLSPTNTDSVFRLTDFSDGAPVLLFDASASKPRIVFAPLTTSPF